MFNFIIQNAGTVIVGVVLLAVVAAIVAGIVRDKRKGKNVGCGCEGCSKTSCKEQKF